MSYTVVTNVPDPRQPLTKVEAPGVPYWINSIGSRVTNPIELNFYFDIFEHTQLVKLGRLGDKLLKEDCCSEIARKSKIILVTSIKL